MGDLHPLGENLPEECRAFAVELRKLFDGLGVSVRRYAARMFRDPSTISRYLSGTRVPPWEFVVDLLADLADCRGSAATPAAIEVVRMLHRAAVRTSGSRGTPWRSCRSSWPTWTGRRAVPACTGRAGEALLDRRPRIADLRCG